MNILKVIEEHDRYQLKTYNVWEGRFIKMKRNKKDVMCASDHFLNLRNSQKKKTIKQDAYFILSILHTRRVVYSIYLTYKYHSINTCVFFGVEMGTTFT